MKKAPIFLFHLFYLFSLFCLFVLSFISTPVLASTSDEMADQYFSKDTLTLTLQEKAAIAIGQKWQTGDETSKPATAEDGSIRFIYGSGQTQILCAVLQVCDIALQAGEQVNNLNVG